MFWAFQNSVAENLLEIIGSFGVVPTESPALIPNLRLSQNLPRRRQCNLAVSPVALPDCGFRYSNPALDGVPFSVIPNEQIFLRAVRALHQAFAVGIGLAIV